MLTQYDSLHKPWAVKLLANVLSPTIMPGLTRHNPKVQVHENSVFVYQSRQPHAVQRLRYFDYAFTVSVLAALVPAVTPTIFLLLPYLLFLVSDYLYTIL